MAEINVKYVAPINDIVGKRKEKILIEDSSSVKELLSVLSRRYGPKFENLLFDEKNEFKPKIMILVNDRLLHKLTTKLNDQDEVLFVYPVVGG